MCKEEKDNTEQIDNNCRYCGSIEEEEGDTHVHCAECGRPKDLLADDGGFVPTNPIYSLDKSHLGSYVGSRSDRRIRRDRRVRRLSTLNQRVAHQKPSFLDGVIDELSFTPGGGYLHAAAAEIVKKANSEQSLGSMRHSLRASPESRDEARQYRQRLFALATLELLEDVGYETPITTLRSEWRIDRYDLMKTKSRLKKLVNGMIACLSNSTTDSVSARRRAMLHQLSTYRDHLVEQESIASASEVFETAKQIASSMGEPIEDDDDWIISDTTNRPTPAVAGKAFMEAMHRHGFSRENILELHGRYPVVTLDTFILKKGWEGRINPRSDDVSEEA
ncbi:MAG: hypothetical protein VYB47_00980 [Candidatus Thermoplasmatota archaeon]|nr:hypothetical protein [Candidatus Thermoplasmatota archaeon]